MAMARGTRVYGFAVRPGATTRARLLADRLAGQDPELSDDGTILIFNVFDGSAHDLYMVTARRCEEERGADARL